MSNLQTRLAKLETGQPADTVAARLGGMAVAEHDADGNVVLAGGETISEAELDARLAGCTGRLIFLDLE
jgi:hypothetical protein